MAKSDGKRAKAKVTAPRPARAGVGAKLGTVGRKARKLAAQPVVSEVVAAALLAAAAALREGGGSKRGGAAGGKSGGPVDEVTREANKLGDALRALAIDVARKTIDAWEEAATGAAAGPPKRRRTS